MSEVVKCPLCRKRIFDLDYYGQAKINIKCPHCKNVVSIIRKQQNAVK